MRFGAYLQELRNRRKMTRTELACRCAVKAPDVGGITDESIKGWELERGGRIPNAGQVDVLLDALELTMEELAHLLRLARKRAATRRRRVSRVHAA